MFATAQPAARGHTRAWQAQEQRGVAVTKTERAAAKLAANTLRRELKKIGQAIEAGLMVDVEQREALADIIAELEGRADPEVSGLLPFKHNPKTGEVTP